MARYQKPNPLQLFQKFIQSLKKGEKWVYVAAGEEDFFISEVVKHARTIIPEELADFNLSIIYGEDHPVEKVVQAAREYPMMAEKRMVIVRHLQQLQGIQSKDGQDLLLSYMDNPNPTTVLILSDSKKLNKRLTLGKKLSKESDTLAFFKAESVPENQLTQWVLEWTEHRYGKRMDVDAAEMLWQLSGSDLTQLASEIEKVCTFVGESNTIEAAAVKEAVGQNRAFSLFDVKNAIMQGRTAEALAMAKQQMQLFNAAGEVIKLINLLYSSLSNIWQIHYAMRKGISQQEFAQQTGMNAWILKRNWQEAQGLSQQALPLVFEALQDADKAIKGMGVHDPEGVMYMTIKRIGQAIQTR